MIDRKAYQAEYRKRPEVKARKAELGRKYRAAMTPEQKAHARAMNRIYQRTFYYRRKAENEGTLQGLPGSAP